MGESRGARAGAGERWPVRPGHVGLAAALGLAGTLAVLYVRQPPDAADAAPAPPATASTASTATPVTIAPVAASPSSAANAPRAHVATRRSFAGLEDAEILERARDEFGIDCAEIDSRRAVGDGAIEVACTNGSRLRVGSTDDGALRIEPAS